MRIQWRRTPTYLVINENMVQGGQLWPQSVCNFMGAIVDIARKGVLPLSTSVRHRRVEAELMDRQDLEQPLLEQALRGLERINRLSLTSRTLWAPIRELVQREKRPIRVLDLGCGGGNLAMDLNRCALRAKLPVHADGCDLSSGAIDFATRRARAHGIASQFFVHDILNDTLPGGYDVFVSSLTLHHLNDDQAIRLLRIVRAARPRLLLISDLIRCTQGFLLAQVGCRILTRSCIVHYDGPRSVAAAYTMEEVSSIADRAGLHGHRVRWSWPFRLVLTWKPE